MSPASSLWKSFADKLKLIYLTRVCNVCGVKFLHVCKWWFIFVMVTVQRL